MKKLLVLLLAATLLFPFSGSAAGAEPRLRIRDEINCLKCAENGIWINEDPAYAKLVNTLLYATQKEGFRGSAVVATDDEIIFASGTGLTELDGSVVTPFTTYEIGSLTKSFTAVCVMKLAEEGRISLQDTAGSFFPEYAACPAYEKLCGVTVSDLLRMRSGLPDYLNAPERFFGMDLILSLGGGELKNALYNEAFVNSLLETVKEDGPFLEYLFSCEALTEPDAAYAYSNTNYRLLAVITERVTGKPYEEYMKETVFDPCGMSDTSAMSDGRAEASPGAEGWHMLNAAIKGAGDIFSSAADLLKYDRALFGGHLLEDASLRELLRPAEGYACGWYAQGDALYHSGGTPGFSTLDYIVSRNGKRLYIISLADLNENLSGTVYRYLDKWFKP